jgi:hypothetical protein
MNHTKLLLPAALILCAVPLHAQAPKPRFLPGTEQVCEAKLADGRRYSVYGRILKTPLNGDDEYVDGRAYYMPGSGEFLWRATTYTKHGYIANLKDRPRLFEQQQLCDNSLRHIVELRDGEWVDFYASNGEITVFHSDLRFPSIDKAWQYVSEHWKDWKAECFPAAGAAKWCNTFSVYKELGGGFFRPERLRFDARPYSYNPLVRATKLDSTWQLEIKGADEPNRAVILLDRNFKLLKITRTAAVE